MATWVTHLMIADAVLEALPQLHRRGFCVGSIAPDCNVENADWTAFTPPREVTHWMRGERKQISDCHAFCEAYILPCQASRDSEEYAFLLGYYAHLLTDAAFQAMIRDEGRVRAVWIRIKADPALAAQAAGLPETWDTAKQLIPKSVRLQEISTLEAEYLQTHPQSGYLTEILLLRSFPDYLDYLPPGAIVRKIGVMGGLPRKHETTLITISRDEYHFFVKSTVALVLQTFRRKGLLPAENPEVEA